MPTLLNVINNHFIKSHYNSIIILILFIIFSITSYYAYKWYYIPTINTTNDFKDVANANRRHKEVIITIYTVDWCPHCTKAKPEWEEFSQKYNDKVINNYVIKCNQLDCTNDELTEIKTIIEKNNIESYPTVIMLKDNKRYDFDAKITTENLSKFVNSIVNE
jgi:thiol-disulfide isomerase/thioredoxin